MIGRFVLWGDKLLLATIGLFFLAYSTYLRVVVRSLFEGSSFGWAYLAGLKADRAPAQVSGRGLEGDAGYILAQAFIVALLIVLCLRRPDRLSRLALLAWTSISLGLSIWVFGFSSEPITVSKETLGIVDVPAGLATQLWPGLAWLGALLLVLRDLAGKAPATATPWTGANTALMLLAALLLAASAALLNLGPQHGQADFLGIGLIYAALFLALGGLCPWADRKSA